VLFACGSNKFDIPGRVTMGEDTEKILYEIFSHADSEAVDEDAQSEVHPGPTHASCANFPTRIRT
jgi:hypothetical protein